MLETSEPAMGECKFDNDEVRWQAVVGRDAGADGRFFYGVMTTGVFCRPSCKSRPALRKNVRFFEDADSALRAGLRPCKRCRPLESEPASRQSKIITDACRLIENCEELPDLDELARKAGMSKFHFHRLFKTATGVTPKAYAAARRAGRLRQGLEDGHAVTHAIYDAGYNASSRFYEESQRRLGMRASQYRDGGRDARIRFAVGQCALGSVLVAATDKGVCAIDFGDDPDELVRSLQDRFCRAELIGGDETFENLVASVVGYIDEPEGILDLPLDIRGTAFQEKVWSALREIPAGSTASYSDVAARIGMPQARRAVGAACRSNPVAVAIPCHRVVRSDGGLSGYRWGVDRKQKLLAREKEKAAAG